MKKQILLSTIVSGLIAATSLNAAEDLSSMFKDGKVSGQIREFSISRSYKFSAATDYTRDANVIGGHLKFETADYKGLSFGTAFYTTYGFLNDSDKTDYTKVDPTLLGENNEGYSLLGEAYVGFKYKNTYFKGGRQKLDTPMAGSDDARMLPNLFEAYILTNNDLEDTLLLAGHVSAFAQGTFGRVYNGGILGATSGYSSVVPNRDIGNVGEFKNMGEYAIGKSTNGVSLASITYTGVEKLKLQLWDYYAYDILNVVYAQADYSWNCLLSDSVHPFAALQYIQEDNVGDDLAGNINSSYWGAKFGAKIENFGGYVAYSQTSKNNATNAATENAIISPWGGMPAFTQGMVTRHQFLAGTKASKVAASYNFKAFGPNLKTTLYYTHYDMDTNNGYTFADAGETGFDLIYYPGLVKNLQLRLRGNFTDDFKVAANGSSVGWDEYRFIVNYNF